MDKECQIIKEKNESAALNYVFQCSQWQQDCGFVLPCHFLNFIDDNYFITITGKSNDTNKHHLLRCVKVM